MSRQIELLRHRETVLQCRRCPNMAGSPVCGQPVLSSVLLVGQAPGPREADLGRPFAWTAGKTLFRWFEQIGVDEAGFRANVYMAAVCRCFPGKNPRGGDRVPDTDEIARCADWLEREIDLLKPRLILPVGKLAIGRFIPVLKLDQVIGDTYAHDASGAELIPLPHPSGASTWHRREPGVSLLRSALERIAAHPAWAEVRTAATRSPGP